jgi:hypothetical protein
VAATVVGKGGFCTFDLRPVYQARSSENNLILLPGTSTSSRSGNCEIINYNLFKNGSKRNTFIAKALDNNFFGA